MNSADSEAGGQHEPEPRGVHHAVGRQPAQPDALEHERVGWADGMAAALRAGVSNDGADLVSAARMFRAAEMTMHAAAAERVLGLEQAVEQARRAASPA